MLSRLIIQNVALIDKIEFDLGSGLNILTGETGAGKSIIIDSINAILGGRLSKDIIRAGQEKAVIEALFVLNDNEKIRELDEMDLDIEDDCILIVREYHSNGKNVCKVNGRMVTVPMLKTIGEKLIDIHGQNENQSLLAVHNHIDFLDNFIGDEILDIRNEYRIKLNQLKTLVSELSELSESPQEIQRKTDMLKFQINEIKSANLKNGEEEELSELKLKLVNSEKICKSLSSSYDIINGNNSNQYSVLSSLNNCIKNLSQITSFDDKYSKASKLLEDIYYNLEEIGRDLRAWGEKIEINPDGLLQIEERLDLIARLKRKYGKNINEIICYNNKLQIELNNIENIETRIKELNDEMISLNQELYEITKKISSIRADKGNILSNKIIEELQELEMKNTKFVMKVDFDDSIDEKGLYKFNKNGLDSVEFYISPNLGEEPKPLSKIASGGEMSRIMLAIKTILAKVDNKPTLIFDEIDSGISGKTAYSVAKKLAYVSQDHQIICVTHLAQIASMADYHYIIEKHVLNNKTETVLRLVTDDIRDEEIAKIMGTSNITDITLEHAREILDTSRKSKEVVRKSS